MIHFTLLPFSSSEGLHIQTVYGTLGKDFSGKLFY